MLHLLYVPKERSTHFAGHIRESVELHTREGVALDWIIVNQNSVACSRPRSSNFFLRLSTAMTERWVGVEGKIERK